MLLQAADEGRGHVAANLADIRGITMMCLQIGLESLQGRCIVLRGVKFRWKLSFAIGSKVYYYRYQHPF